MALTTPIRLFETLIDLSVLLFLITNSKVLPIDSSNEQELRFRVSRSIRCDELNIAAAPVLAIGFILKSILTILRLLNI